MLAMAVMLSHPAPHQNILHQYMSPNLAQYSRHWMCAVLLMGSIPLLQPKAVTQHNQHSLTIKSTPATLIQWHNNQYSEQVITRGQQLFLSPKQPTVMTTIVSPKHQLINKIHSQQLQNTIVNVPVGTAKRREQSITTRNRDPTLPKIIGAQKVLKKQQPRSKTSKKRPKPPSQLTLFDTMPLKPPPTTEVQEDVWGHFPEVIDSDLTLRLFFNNPNGLKLTSDPISVQYSLSLIQAIGAGVICLAETNVNWSNLRVSNTLRNITKKFGNTLHT